MVASNSTAVEDHIINTSEKSGRIPVVPENRSSLWRLEFKCKVFYSDGITAYFSMNGSGEILHPRCPFEQVSHH